jgi:2-keto-3-deoxy-L-fuconate dehydrogenase
MSNGPLAAKRVLVTSANTYMGPAIVELFKAEGAEVIADTSKLTDPDGPAELISTRVISTRSSPTSISMPTSPPRPI